MENAPERIAVVVGTRPEIVKLAPLIRILATSAWVAHSCQHDDRELSDVFLRAAGIERTASISGVRGEPRYRQFAQVIGELGDIFKTNPPAAVIVQGDTNTTAAAAQAASFSGVPLIHVEAGLRSHDRAMPEEINRCVTSVLADLHCAPTELAVANLQAEGVPAERIRLTGNTIVEATLGMLPSEREAWRIVDAYGVEPDRYVLATIHRPENADDPARLRTVLEQLASLGLPVLVPLHPRTRNSVIRFELGEALSQLRVIAPVDHRTFLGLARHARLLVSDSGGVQEECTIVKRPLIVVRNSTERPESIAAGFAHLVRPGPGIGELGRDLIADPDIAERLAATPCPFGDGLASERIAGLARGFIGRAGGGRAVGVASRVPMAPLLTVGASARSRR